MHNSYLNVDKDPANGRYHPIVRGLESASRIINGANWVHVRPWQPWMLMGTAPGHLLYHCFTGCATRLEDVPPHIAGIVEKRLPTFLQPPDKPGRSEGSLSRYMRTRKPAPPRALPQP